VYRRVCACIAGLVYRANLDRCELYTADYVAFSRTLRERAVTRAGRMQLLVGNVEPTKLTTLSLKLHGYPQREADVCYKKNGCRISMRPSDIQGTDGDCAGAETRRRAPGRYQDTDADEEALRASCCATLAAPLLLTIFLFMFVPLLC